MVLLSALSIGLAVDLFIGVGLALFVHADKRYQAEKLARLAAEGLYRPETVDEPLPARLVYR